MTATEDDEALLALKLARPHAWRMLFGVEAGCVPAGDAAASLGLTAAGFDRLRELAVGSVRASRRAMNVG